MERRSRSEESQRQHQAAVPLQAIEAAFDLQRAVAADVAIVDLAVVTDLLDDLVGPDLLSGRAPGRCRVHGRRKRRIVGSSESRMRVDVRLRDAELLGDDHRLDAELHDVEPLVIAVPNGWRERRDFIVRGEDDVVVHASSPAWRARRPMPKHR